MMILQIDAFGKLSTTVAMAAGFGRAAAFWVTVIAVVWQLQQQLAPVGLPHPYSGESAVPVPPTSFSRFPTFPANLTGLFGNRLLEEHATRMFEGKVHGAESVAVAPDGTLIMIDRFGYIHTASPTTTEGASAVGGGYTLSAAAPLYIGPGRPLGFHIVDNGSAVVVCDSLKGLTRVELRTGTVTILSNRVSPNVPHAPALASASTDADNRKAEINYVNDLDVAKDGSIYFTSSTAGTVARHPLGFSDTLRSFLLNMCKGDHTGRVLQ